MFKNEYKNHINNFHYRFGLRAKCKNYSKNIEDP